MGVGISKAIGPESSFQSEISKSNMMVMPPMPPQNTYNQFAQQAAALNHNIMLGMQGQPPLF